MQHLQQEVDSQIEKSPAIIREAIFSSETAEAVQKIGEKYHLHIDQMGYLAGEIGFVMLGLEPSANFVANIRDRLQIDQTTAESVAADCNTEIFSKIRESLKQGEENRGIAPPLPAEVPASPAGGLAETGPLPELGELRDRVEHPSPVAIPPHSIFERKLNETVNLKATETKIDPYLEPTEQP